MTIVWSQERVVLTTKDFDLRVTWFLGIKGLKRCFVIQYRCTDSVDKIGCIIECFPLKLKRYISLSKECQSSFNKVSIFSLSLPILMMCIRAGISYSYPFISEIKFKGSVFTPHITLNCFDFQL